jgi:hypothetical protein
VELSHLDGDPSQPVSIPASRFALADPASGPSMAKLKTSVGDPLEGVGDIVDGIVVTIL